MARQDVHVEVEGLAKFRRDLNQLEPAVDKEAQKEIKQAVGKIATTAGAQAPRQSGDLAHSIRPFGSGARLGVGSKLPYAKVLEYGGTIQPRGVPIKFQPSLFVTKAVEDHADELVEDIGNAVDRAARRVGWH